MVHVQCHSRATVIDIGTRFRETGESESLFLSERCGIVARKLRVFNKGSIIPSILKIEEQLMQSEDEAREEAEKIIARANADAEEIMRTARQEIRGIEEDERNKLLDQMETGIDELTRSEEKRLRELMETIEGNRGRALDSIMNRILPGGR